jgi:4-amino-4-deoxy-L-arabinose transferase-like glycosyltransferase
LGLGLAVRLIVMVSYFPAVMLSADSPRYARIDGQPMFGDFWMPAGYPLVLRFLRGITDQLWFTIAVQHVIGLSAGVILFLAMRRLGARHWVACLPAAVAFLSGDHIYLEHMIMAEFLITFLATAGLATAVFGLAGGVRPRLLAAASALLGMAALTKSVGIILIPVLMICTLLFANGPRRARLRALSFALFPGLAILGIYFVGCKLAHGKYRGLSDMRGWNLYSRVAPFADCRKFSPPAGTAVLCEQTPTAERPGPFFYVWDSNSIARRHFRLGPKTGEQLGAFAVQVILHQPFDYLRAVVIDLARYIEPATGRHWPYAGQTDGALAFGWHDPSVEQQVVTAMSRGYRGTQPHIYGPGLLNFYQQFFRLSGLILATLLLLTFVGMGRRREPLELGIMLFGLAGLALYILPVATLCYDFRYGVPPSTLIAVSGVLGGVSLRDWWTTRKKNA